MNWYVVVVYCMCSNLMPDRRFKMHSTWEVMTLMGSLICTDWVCTWRLLLTSLKCIYSKNWPRVRLNHVFLLYYSCYSLTVCSAYLALHQIQWGFWVKQPDSQEKTFCKADCVCVCIFGCTFGVCWCVAFEKQKKQLDRQMKQEICSRLNRRDS